MNPSTTNLNELASNHRLSSADLEVRSAVERGVFPLLQLDHGAHIRLAYVYLSATDTAQQQMRNSLQAYLQANKVDQAKYHETLTCAWMQAVRHFMDQTEASNSADDFIAQQPQILKTEKMLTHYSPELLFSDEARARFVSADLQAIPACHETRKIEPGAVI